MGKSKSGALTRLPKDQRCQFLIGPISSWFMPDTSDIWTRPMAGGESNGNEDNNESMDIESNCPKESNTMSYFAYGSLGSICYGEIHRAHDKGQQNLPQSNCLSAIVKHLIDIKEDNSRVSCIHFLKPALFPMIMALTESGSFLFHDCVKNETLIHIRKSELISRVVSRATQGQDNATGEHHSKKAKFNVIQQINSCLWPTATNAFLGISLLKEKTNLLIWLKLKDLTSLNDNSPTITKTDLIESHEILKLDLPQYVSPICCMDCSMIDSKTCLIAVGMDDGLIKVVQVNFDTGQSERIVTLARHKDQICSMSLFVDDRKRFPLGLLASISRDGLTLLWNIENESYFADYQAASDRGGGSSRVNWFSLSFVTNSDVQTTNLAVSNSESGLTLLEIPENTRSKIRLSKPTKAEKQKGGQQTIRHQALIFNVVFDPLSQIILTSSLDGNNILWTSHRLEMPPKEPARKSGSIPLEARAQYLIPSLPNNSRVHMMRHSPIQESLLGLCLGKAGVRFYKITENLTRSRFDMSTGANMIARKITKANLCPTSLAWHPRNEYRVAIGTLEGKLLRVDLTPNRSTLIEAECRITGIKTGLGGEIMSVDSAPAEKDIFDVEYQPVSRDTVAENSEAAPKTDGIYSICWGPNPACPQDENRLAIYAVGSISHRLFIYKSNKDAGDKLTNYLDEFLDQSLPEAIGEASEVAWKSGFDLMALGTTHGKVIIVEYLEESHADRSRGRLFRKLAVIKDPMGTTYIQCLVWHPTLDKNDAHYYHIACSANESAMFIFDIKAAKEDSMLATDVRTRLTIEDNKHPTGDTANSGPVIVSNFLYELAGHKKAISDVAWNPHNPLELATSSFDRYCYVWTLDGESTARVSSKFCSRDRLFTVEWSLQDDDLLFTSGHDSTVWAWRPSENLNKNNAPMPSD